MNTVILMGRLVREPEVRQSQGEKVMTIARFTLAIDRKFKRESEQSSDFINCVVFGKTAETIEKYVTKGSKIAVIGHIQTGSYTNKDGQKVNTFDVVVDDFEFCESKASGGNEKAPTNSAKAGNTKANNRPNPATANMGYMNIPDGIDDDELPFN